MPDVTLDKNKWGLEDESNFQGVDNVNNIGDMGVPSSMPKFDFLSKLKAQTGTGSIETYQDHLMNPKKSKGMAQILRGITGLVGELNFAILDIVFGFFQLQKEGGEQNVGDSDNKGFSGINRGTGI